MFMKKVARRLGFVLSIGIIFLGIFLGFHETKSYSILKVEELIEEKRKQNYMGEKEDRNLSTYVNPFPTIRAEYQNQNIMGKVEIPALKITTWITRAADNSYYLNHNIYNQKDLLGSPFFDFRNTDLVHDKQINIYGHNTNKKEYADRLPLINLEAYTDEKIFKNYNDVYLSIDEKQIHYEVIAVKVITEKEDEHMHIHFSDSGEYLGHMSKLLDKTMYKQEDLELSKDSRLLILQICHYQPIHTYLLVICCEKA